MINVQEFRNTHKLTDRKWRTMKERFRSEHPGIDFTVREGMDYYISDSALPIFESYLPTQKQSTETQSASRWAIVPRQESAITARQENTGETVEAYIIDTEEQTEQFTQAVSEKSSALGFIRHKRQALNSAIENADLIAMQDRLETFELMVEFEELKKAEIRARVSGSKFELGKRLEEVATALGIAS